MKILKNKFDHFEPELEKDIWADIEKQLKKEEKKGLLFALNWKPMLGMAAAITLLATSIIVWKILPSDTQQPVLTQNITTPNDPTLSVKTDSSQELENAENVTQNNTEVAENQAVENALPAKSVSLQQNSNTAQKTGKTQKVVKTYLVQVTETVEEVKSSKSNQQTTVYQPISKEVEYKEVKIEPKKEAVSNHLPAVVENPKTKEEKTTETPKPLQATPKTRKPTEWTVYEIPQTPKTKTKSMAKTVAQRDDANELDFDNFSWDKALTFAAKKLSKTESRPLEVEHKKDVWRYLFKLKDVEVEHKKHISTKTEREL